MGKRSKALLRAITQCQSAIVARDEDIRDIFKKFLDQILELTQSEYGFLGEIRYSNNNVPYIHTYALTDISWNDATRKFYEHVEKHGGEFRNLETLFGLVLTTGEIVISNDPANDPRRGGVLKIPVGHRPLNSFIGIPLNFKGKMIGMLGLANSPGGYSDTTVQFLQPVTMTCANILYTHKAEAIRYDHETQRSVLLANLSHDMRTPLNGILGACEILHSSPQSQEARDRCVDVIRQSGNTLLIHVENLVKLFQVQSGALTTSYAAVDLMDCVKHVVQMVSRVAEEKGLPIQIETNPNIATSCFSDRNLLIQALSNLVQNAVKFTSSGTIKITVDARREFENDHANGQLSDAERKTVLETTRYMVQIEDTGTGIATDRVSSLFNPFTQLDNTQTRTVDGVGVGLCVAHRIAALLGGDIHVESELHKGSRFTFSFIAEPIKNPSPMPLDTCPRNSPLLTVPRSPGPVTQTSPTASGHNTTDKNKNNKNNNADGEGNGCNGSKDNDNSKALMRFCKNDGRARPLSIDVTSKCPFSAVLKLESEWSQVSDSSKRSQSTIFKPPPLFTSKSESSLPLSSCRSEPLSPFKPVRVPSQFRQTTSALSANQNSHLSSLRVLVVEDNSFNLFVSVAMLEKLGVTDITIAANGQIAVDKVKAELPFDIIFMDLHMPVLDGFESAKMIRQLSKSEDTPYIVATTASVTPEYKLRSHDVGMNAFLDKPVSLKSLARLLEIFSNTNTNTNTSSSSTPAVNTHVDVSKPFFTTSSVNN